MFESLSAILETTVPFLKTRLWGNSISDYLISLAILLAGIVLILVTYNLSINSILQRKRQTDKQTDNFFIRLVKQNLFPLFFFGLLYLATRNLKLNSILAKALDITGIFLLSLIAVRFTNKAAKYWLTGYLVKKEADEKKIITVQKLFPTFNLIIWIIGIAFLLDNIGFNITTVVAGLGIGGVAIALASQSFLKDLFSYFYILLDHPFVEGDFIIVEEFMGTVEKIGIRSTRIRSLSGEQIIIPNTNLTDTRIKNYKEMQEKRVEFKIGIVYETPLEQVKEVPGILKAIIESTENTRFDRAHFFSYGDFSLVYVAVYYVLSTDYNLYMDIQQQINFRIYEEFKRRNIAFAYPTQLVHINPVNQPIRKEYN
jgi:small-conductance mechanosensitive channel